MTDEAWKRLQRWAEATSDSGPEHLSLVEWYFYLLGGQAVNRSREELAAHIHSCESCREILDDQRALRGQA